MRQLYTSILSIRVALLLTIGLSFSGNAQYYTIPDASFASWLVTHYPTCMNGNQLDTTCSSVTTEISVNVSNTGISSLDGIQFFDNLNTLDCSLNFLSTLPTLPQGLTILICNENTGLSSIPSLPLNLTTLVCNFCNLNSLPNLPLSLTFFDCSNNSLTSLPALPLNLTDVVCRANFLTAIPSLPLNLTYLDCSNNSLTTLPSLPSSLIEFFCDGNQLTSLPTLPLGLQLLYCEYNQLTSLPTLHPNLTTLVCFNNLISCFDGVLPEDGVINENLFTCVPNQTSYTGSFPLCFENDLLNNPNNCPSAIDSGFMGRVIVDQNADCMIDLFENGVSNIKMNLYNSSDIFLATTYTDGLGYYYFPQNNGTYHIELDTLGQSYRSSCITDSIIAIPTTLNNLLNFTVDCNSPTDLGVMAIAPIGLVFPGEIHSLRTYTGNMLANYPFNCLNSASGTITITVSGPVVFEDIPIGSLTPSLINGNTFVYEIFDFSTFSYSNYLSQNFSVNNTAQLGELICVTVSISAPLNDPDTLNNHMQFCYQIGNSFDPNIKEVYPYVVEPFYNDYLTYTIHFQNTGTAPAINIYLEDTLNSYLDIETYELLHASHPVIPTLQGNNLKFHFNNIQLADSTSNEEASHGFVQYRIKPISGLPAGTVIPNTASIYFDYNDPIVTNTVTTTFSDLSVNNLSNEIPVVYPNPSSGLYFVKSAASISEIAVFNLAGEHILQQQNTQSTISIDLSNQPAGVYLLKTNDVNQTNYIRLVKL